MNIHQIYGNSKGSKDNDPISDYFEAFQNDL